MLIDPTFHEKRADADKKWYTYPLLKKIDRVPIHLDLELNTTCNLKCKMCFHSFPELAPPDQLMDFELAQRLIIEFAEKGGSNIKFNCRGEPLLYSRLPDLIKLAKDKGVTETCINTNGTLLTPIVGQNLIAAGLDRLNVSIDGVEEYFKMRGVKFETVKKRLNDFLSMRGVRRKPIVRVQSLISGVESYWSNDERIDEVSHIECFDYTKSPIEDKEVHKDWCCAYLWQRLLILADGSYVPCTGGFAERKIIGHAQTTTIEEIWHSKILEVARDIHAQGLSHKCDWCRFCPMRYKILHK